MEAWTSGPRQTVVDLLRRRPDVDPDGAYLDACGTTLTAGAVARIARRLAGAAAHLGVEPGRPGGHAGR